MFHRFRRLRRSEASRRLVREHRLSVDQLIYPLFVAPGIGYRQEVPSMPGVFQLSVDQVESEMEKIVDAGIPGVLLFGLPEHKDADGSEAWNPSAPVQRATESIKKKFPEVVVMTDVCLCEYTAHGHCGPLTSTGEVDNDAALTLLARVACSHADAGADWVAPSDMMDGRVAAIRRALDESGHQQTAILSYAAKYASGFYGPFRDAAGSTPSFGDRRSYQMDPANRREALCEVAQDIEEGADAVMVKPALAYLDVVRDVRAHFDQPLAVYNVSGEYSMIKAAAARGWLDERTAVLETLTAMQRAGADMIITYWALDVSAWLKGERR